MTPQRVLEHPRAENSSGLLHGIFEARAEAQPDAVAVVHGNSEITYAELDARANRLARYLRRRGVRPGDTVAMVLPRSIRAYSSILGILKAGAAYVPIDPAYPADRIAWMRKDSGASAVLTAAALDAHAAEIAAESAEALADEDSAQPHQLCYVIYTSGSTGTPKGVMVEHRNASHLVRAERHIFNVRSTDRVYQGASLSFDLSVEEIWLAFAAGATLISATPEMARAGPDLSRALAHCGVTVLSCVPTLLSLLDENIPSLRLLILGGETCPAPLVAKWARAGRRIVNTYGPTETTVIATYADVSPDCPVTIGNPVAGYEIHILDENLRPVPAGETGEICIGGAGVARGYVGLPDETRARFIPDGTGARIYRSGDLGRFDSAGNLEFAGRADGQVKLRGLRVELGEIEAALLRIEGVRAAACVLRESDRGDPQLVAYIVPRNAPVNEQLLRSQLRGWLPDWMVPSLIESLACLPLLPSGKLDRASLPAPRVRKKCSSAGSGTKSELALLKIWNSLFQPLDVSLHDDFFLDLGGHSLLAARMVSELRRSPEFASVTMREVYDHPTIFRLAAAIDTGSATTCQEHAPPFLLAREDQDQNVRRHFLAGVIQSASLYFVFAFRGVQWIAPYLIYFILAAHRSILASMAWAAASAFAMLPALILTAVCAKWILLGRVRPGLHPLWGWYYLRWWFVQTLIRSIPLKRLGGTPLLPFVYRLFGAKVASNVHIATDLLAAFDVISIGEAASIDEGASLLGYAVEDGHLVVGPISVGCRGFVGTHSVLSPHTVIEDGARLDDLSLLSSGARIPAAQTWAGSPPRRVFPDSREPHPPPAPSGFRRFALTVLYASLACALPLAELIAFLPGIAILIRFNPAQMRFYLAAPLAGASFIICLTAIVVLLKWLLIGRARAGRYAVHGGFYVRNWVVEQLLSLSVDSAGPLHATLFLKPWYRALGARLGRFVEISNASVTTPDLLTLGDDCTIADEVSLGAARVEGGWLTLGRTKLGRRVFVGNNAVIPAGTVLADESLVGVLTIAPSDMQGSETRRGACLLGSPPILLPRRQPGSVFPEQRTFRPNRSLQCMRGCFEIFRVTAPGAGFITVAVAVIDTAVQLWGKCGPLMTLLLLPVVFTASCGTVTLLVVAAKWIVMGRYRPFEQPFWSALVWRLELVNALFEFLATPIGLEALRGTPLLPWYLRLLGARVGRRVYIDSTGFLEFDLISIGDRSILNHDCILQTHLFEDRVLKASGLRVGADCEIGAQSVVLYGAEMQDQARLGPLSLVMKGEVLPAGKVWVGSPLSMAASLPFADINSHK